MAHINDNNANVSGNSIGNPDRGDSQVQQRVHICKDTSNLKPSILKRKFENKKGSSSTQEPNRGQWTRAVNTPISPVILAPTQPYLGTSHTAASATTIFMEFAKTCIAIDAT